MEIPAIIKSSVPKACLKQKGDLATAKDDGQLETVPVGPDGTVLTADSAQPTGVKWAPVNGSSGSIYWGSIFGNLTDQADLQTALQTKSEVNHTHVSAQVGLGNVTNDKQVKAAIASTPGNLVSWSGATGDAVVDSGKNPADFAAASHTHPPSQVGLGNVTNDAQVKKALSSVDGDLVVWSGTTGDTVADSGKKLSDLALATHDHAGVYEPADANIQAHLASTANPHNVTADQTLPAQAGMNGKFLTTNGATVSWGDPSSGAPPTGTGFRHVTGGAEDAAAQLVTDADVAPGAAIAESKLCLNYPTHANANDPTAAQKAALAGTSGTPGLSNKYVTEADPRNTDARTPTAHGSSAHTGTIGTPAQVGLGNVTNEQQLTVSQLDTDGTLAANSDSRLPSQKAVKSYVDNNFAPIAQGVTGGDSHNHTGGSGAAIPESGLLLSDVTTGDVSMFRHGFIPKLPGGTTTFFRADGTFAAPTGGSLPAGGITGQVLKKNSATDGDAGWYDNTATVALPWITVGDAGYATLDGILAGTPAAGTTLVVPAGTHTLSATINRTVPTGVELEILRGAIIEVPTGRTLTINGSIQAGAHKIFTLTGTGVVALGSGVTKAYVEWWGATGDGATNDESAITAAIKACMGKCPLIFAPNRTYKMIPTASITTTLTGDLELIGNNSTIYYYYGTGGYTYTLQGEAVATPTLSANATYGDTTISVDDGSLIQAGDIISLGSSTIVVSAWSTCKSDIHRIRSIAGNDVTLETPLRWSYSTGESGLSLTVKRPRRFTSKGVNYKVGTTSGGGWIDLSYLGPIFISDTIISGTRVGETTKALLLTRTVDAFINNVVTLDVDDPIMPRTARNTHVTNIIAYNNHHPVDPQYWCDGVYIKNLIANNVDGVSNHPSFDVNYDTVISNDGTFGLRSLGDSSARNVKIQVPGVAEDLHIGGSLYLTAEGLADGEGYGSFIIENFEFITPDFNGTNPAMVFCVAGGKYVRVRNLTADRIAFSSTDHGIDAEDLHYKSFYLNDGAMVGKFVKETAAQDLTKGDICYSWAGRRKASADQYGYNAMEACGRSLLIAAEDIASGQLGSFLVEGLVRMDSWGLGAASTGSKIFLSTTAGIPAITRPSGSGDSIVEIGTVTGIGNYFGGVPIVIPGWYNIAYAASMTPDLYCGLQHKISPNNATAFTINAPLHPRVGADLTIMIYNNYNGTHGNITWNSIYKMGGALGKPAYQKARSVTFWYDGTCWWEKSRVDVDM